MGTIQFLQQFILAQNQRCQLVVLAFHTYQTGLMFHICVQLCQLICGTVECYQEYTIFDNKFLSEEFVKNLCNEYEGTIFYDRLILGKWVRAEGAIYRRFADNPKNFYCQITDKINTDLPYRQFLKSELEEVTIGIDFGGNKSGHAFVATAKTKGRKKRPCPHVRSTHSHRIEWPHSKEPQKPCEHHGKPRKPFDFRNET